MKIVMTVREIVDAGLWQKFCDATGTNEWARNEGLVDDDTEFTITPEQAEEMGFKPLICFDSEQRIVS